MQTQTKVATDEGLQQDVWYFYSALTAMKIIRGVPPHRDAGKPRKLASTVLGRLLHIYVNRFQEQGCARLYSGKQDWVFNIKTTDLVWDFASQYAGTVQQDVWCIRLSEPCEGIQGHTSYTEDRRKGSMHMSFNMEEYIQSQRETARSASSRTKPRNDGTGC